MSTLTIFKTLFRDTRRDETILSFQQNLIEETDEIKQKVFHENHQNNSKELSTNNFCHA